MKRHGLVPLAGGLLLLAVLGSDALAAGGPVSPVAAEELRLRSIDRTLDRLERECRRLQDDSAGPEAWKAGVAQSGLRQLRGVRARLERWLGKRHLDPYRRNLGRFLRDLEVRLERLESRLAAAEMGQVGPPGSALPDVVEKTAKPPLVRPSDFDSGRSGGPHNDECAAAIPIGNGTFIGSTAGAGSDGETSCGSTPAGSDVWFRYVASASGEISFNTFGSSFDTVLSLHQDCPGTSANELRCNDDELGLQSELEKVLGEGHEVIVRLAGFGDAAGDYVLNTGPTAEIFGVVVDAVTGEGLGGGLVRVYDDKGERVGSEETDADGTFEVDGLRAGTYFAKASHIQHFDQLHDGIACPGYCDPLTGTPIALALGDRAPVDFALGPGAKIEGRVTDEASGAPIQIVVAVYDDGGNWQDENASSTSGDYSIGRLLPGTYFAVVEGSQGYVGEVFDGIECSPQCDLDLGTPIVVAAEATAQADFSLRLGGSITGRVTDSVTGQPLDSAVVTIFDGSGLSVDGVSTDPLGEYTASGLPAGSYFAVAAEVGYLDQLYDSLACPPGCDPTAGSPIAVTLGNATAGVDFALVRTSAFTGILQDAAFGVPVTDAWVDAWNDEGEWVGAGSADAAGVYTVESVAAGDYFATTDNLSGYIDELFDDLPCANGGCDPASGTPISLAPAMTTTGIDFALEFGGSITGRLTDASGAAPVHGRVQVWDGAGAPVASTWTDNGGYRALGLLAGDYFVATDSIYHDELYDDILCPGICGSPAGGTPVPVTPGVETGGIDFALCHRPKLELYVPPHPNPDSLIDGCRVQIDGLATSDYPGCPEVDSIRWQWGDFTTEFAPFPASHLFEPPRETVPFVTVAFDTMGKPSLPASGEIALWDCLLPGACGEPDQRVMSEVALDSVHLIQACTTIALGPALDIVSPADVTFLAGESIGLLDGVRILGDRVVIDDDPGLLP